MSKLNTEYGLLASAMEGITSENYEGSSLEYATPESTFIDEYYLDVTATQNGGYVESETISRDLTTDFSISFWLKTGPLQQIWQQAFYWGAIRGTTRDAYNRLTGVAMQYRGYANTSNYIDVGGAYANFMDPYIDDGNWHNIILTYDSTNVQGTDVFSGTDVQNKFKLYVDGSNVPFAAGAGTSSFNASEILTNFRVGDFVSGWQEPSFDINEFAHWGSTKLTSSEASKIYNLGTTTDLQNTSGVTPPTRYWQYEDANNLTKDTISDSNQGTVNGGTQGAQYVKKDSTTNGNGYGSSVLLQQN